MGMSIREKQVCSILISLPRLGHYSAFEPLKMVIVSYNDNSAFGPLKMVIVSYNVNSAFGPL